MHTVKGKKSQLSTFPGPAGIRIFSPSIRKDQPFSQSERQLATPCRATVSWCASPRGRAGAMHGAIWAYSAQVFGFEEPQSISLGPPGKRERLWALPTGRRTIRKSCDPHGSTWQNR